MASVSAIRHNPDFVRKYRELRERGKPPKVALTAIMRKMLVLANALLGDDRLWSPEPNGTRISRPDTLNPQRDARRRRATPVDTNPSSPPRRQNTNPGGERRYAETQ